MAIMQLWPPPLPPIRIGVVHSLTGSMAVSERPLVDAVSLAVEEINAGGGLLGRPVDMVVADGASDGPQAAREAERLITQEDVSVLFACWTSACRKAVLPVVEKYDHLMFYPVQYEGLEMSPNILYTGAAPNQQIIPGSRWAINHFGKRVFLLGSDYIFPRTANMIIGDLIASAGGEVVAERYSPLGSIDFAAVVEEIRQLRPDVVLNTINGESNRHFLRALKDGGMGGQAVVSFSMSEVELQSMTGDGYLPEHYAVWSYFQSLPGAANQQFVEAFRQRFGPQRVTSDPIVAAYVGVKLWANAVRDTGTVEPEHVNRVLIRQSVQGPTGVIAVDRRSRHLWRPVYIGQAQSDGSFDIVHGFSTLVRPEPFPGYRSVDEWHQFARTLSSRPHSEAVLP
jgi:urea transport system substrate-binding protein